MPNPYIIPSQPNQQIISGQDQQAADYQSALSNFLNDFGKPNKVCRMCPTKNDTESVLIHLDNVSRKKIPVYAK